MPWGLILIKRKYLRTKTQLLGEIEQNHEEKEKMIIKFVRIKNKEWMAIGPFLQEIYCSSSY